MSFEEQAVVFRCGDARLIAILSRPQQPLKRGVLVIVGGPQYRAGSHRQFTLLCRALAARGMAAMRFDYRGMGDSEDETRNFEDILPDIRAAIDEFCMQVPQLREVAIWGLCDAASAALFYAHRDARVTGLVLINPWVRTPEGIAKTRLKHYYWSRFIDKEFWRKVARGEFAAATSIRSFAGTLMIAFGARKEGAAADNSSPAPARAAATLPERMAEGLSRFKGRALLILSGEDLTAREFEEVVRASSRWRRLLADARIERRNLPAANHTFSRSEWRDQVATWTAAWMRSW
jgi:uncharacterized protein